MECGSQVRNANKNQGYCTVSVCTYADQQPKQATRRATAADANVS